MLAESIEPAWRPASTLKLAAIDLDGTLLGADGRVSPANAAALRRLLRAGLHVVLASGRHHLNIQPVAAAAAGIQWLISCQGGEVSNVKRDTVLATHYLPQPAVASALEIGRSLGFTLFVYRFDAVYTDSFPNDDIAFYSALAGRPPLRCPSQTLPRGDAFKVLWVGAPGPILRARELNPLAWPGTQMVQTHARILEFMPLDISKATGLSLLAKRLGVRPAQAIAFGDGENDVPMFQWAGVSLAMPHGWPSALDRATFTGPSGPPDTAFARAVDFAFAPPASASAASH
jgi:Cof subfamily protein (haloacid dehalogenase superfamily)